MRQAIGKRLTQTSASRLKGGPEGAGRGSLPTRQRSTVGGSTFVRGKAARSILLPRWNVRVAWLSVYGDQPAGDVIALACRCAMQLVVPRAPAPGMPRADVPRLHFDTLRWTEIVWTHVRGTEDWHGRGNTLANGCAWQNVEVLRPPVSDGWQDPNTPGSIYALVVRPRVQAAACGGQRRRLSAPEAHSGCHGRVQRFTRSESGQAGLSAARRRVPPSSVRADR